MHAPIHHSTTENRIYSWTHLYTPDARIHPLTGSPDQAYFNALIPIQAAA